MRPRKEVTRRAASAWLCVLFCLLCWLLYRTAWVSDDAFISLRTVSNFLEGYGLRWNASERVQTFTHPAWVLLLTAAHALTGEPFYSALYLSLGVSTLAVGCLLFAHPGHTFDKTLVLVALAFSQAFVDFSSSGLENPLTHCLLVLFCVACERVTDPTRRAVALSILAGLAAFNRLDTALLFAPALARSVWQARRSPSVWLHGVGALPLAVWEVFSIIYYGFPFPNTAYAKLGQSPGAMAETLLKGFNYFRSSFEHDPISLGMISAVPLLCWRRRDKETLFLWLGALCYLLYVMNIGGDFMSGRFVSAPLALSAACLLRVDALSSVRIRALAAGVAVALALLGQYKPLLTGTDFGLAHGESDVDKYGIHNERRLFFSISSLRNADKMNPLRADHPWSRSGFELRVAAAQQPHFPVQVIDAIGYVGYFAGPRVHIVDHWALADALIARLPAVFGQYGHYPRILPAGYLESLNTGVALLADPELRQYYVDLSKATQGELWSAERWRAIWRLNTGKLAPLLDHYAYERGRDLTVSVAFVNPTKYPCVHTYVWNDYHATDYLLDSASQPGKSYELSWSLTAHQARLLQPASAERRADDLRMLTERGFFTVTIAFKDRPDGPIRELHELRYTYVRRGEQLEAQRHPWPVWNADFPVGPWNEGRAPGVLQSDEMTAGDPALHE